MKLSKAIRTTLEDWLFRRDPTTSRLTWLIHTCLLAPIVPFTVASRVKYEEPERNPDFKRRP